MDAEFRPHLAFHLTGTSTRGVVEPVAGRSLRPLLMAGRRDLAALRYDYPLVLTRGEPAECVQSLTAMVDHALRELAPRGPAGERRRRLALRAEREVRRLLGEGEQGSLSALWALASARLAVVEPTVSTDLHVLGAALGDGELVDCDGRAARRLVTHLWRAVHRAKARRFGAVVARLRQKLHEILRAELLGSPAGRTPEQLRAALGGAVGEVFDFDALSRVLTRTASGPAPEGRMRRIREALAVLERQAFFRGDAGEGFVFDSCAAAQRSYQARLPEMRRVARALAIAELEADGLYVEARHDSLFDRLFERTLRPGDAALFPDYLIHIEVARAGAGEGALLLELLSAGMPIKAVVTIDDILAPYVPDNGHHAFGVSAARLASVAMGLGQVHVVQAAGSHLHAVRDRVLSGITGERPALFSVYSGAGRDTRLPSFLAAAAAVQSRAFPVWSYDPAAGADWASRLSVAGNPQPERDWPVHAVELTGPGQERIAHEVAFTFVDFAACDARHAEHFAIADRAADSLVPAAEVIAGGAGRDLVPQVLMVDDDDIVHQVLVDEHMVLEARRCAESWRSLRELGGILDSRAVVAAAEEVTPAQAAAAEEPATEEPAARAPGDPYIETPRCTTCNECTRLNDRMFAYDDNKQAYIKDPDAGTFAQLVQAAESCQVSIIHPGKPRNPREPGLVELIERAQPFQ